MAITISELQESNIVAIVSWSPPLHMRRRRIWLFNAKMITSILFNAKKNLALYLLTRWIFKILDGWIATWLEGKLKSCVKIN